jgi:predicted nuclease of predicted toxin-antitoxin system
MAIRYHLDEHVDAAIALGLRRRGIDVSTTVDAGLRSARDADHVAFAAAQRRVIITSDPDFLRLAASGIEHHGIVFSSSGTRRIGQIIEYLTILHACMTEDEMLNHIEFF